MSSAEKKPAKGDKASWNRAQVVPVWLLVLVLVLLVAVVGVGAYTVVYMANRPAGGDMTSPVVEWQAKLKANPDSVDARLGLAYAYQEEGQYAEAVKNYDKVLAKDPKNVGALYNRGVCLLKLDRAREAESDLKQVLKLSPRHVLAAESLGDYYREQRRYSEIILAVKPAADANPEVSDLHGLLGIAYENIGQEEKAIAEYRVALRSTPDLKLAKEGLARLEGSEK